MVLSTWYDFTLPKLIRSKLAISSCKTTPFLGAETCKEILMLVAAGVRRSFELCWKAGPGGPPGLLNLCNQAFCVAVVALPSISVAQGLLLRYC